MHHYNGKERHPVREQVGFVPTLHKPPKKEERNRQHEEPAHKFVLPDARKKPKPHVARLCDDQHIECELTHYRNQSNPSLATKFFCPAVESHQRKRREKRW